MPRALTHRSPPRLALLATLVAVATFAAPTLAAAARGPSTPQERRRALEVTRKLERTPFAPGADADRKWLFKWIVDIPDITVRGCASPLLALLQDDGSRHGRMLYAQSMFGQTAYMIQNPARKDDWVGIQLAGIESTLRAYQSMKQADPQLAWQELDMLQEAAKQDKLRAFVEENMESCSADEGPGPGDAI
jgi:hypothetical protein